MRRPALSRSLHARLLAFALIWLLIALPTAGAAIALLFKENVEHSIRIGLAATLSRIAAVVEPAARPPRLKQPLADPRYDIPASGLYWQIQDVAAGELARSRSLWDFVLRPSPGAGGQGQFEVLAGPGDSSLTTLSRDLTFGEGDQRRSLTVTVAEDRSILSEMIARFGRDLAVTLALLGAAILGAAWMQVNMGLRPFSSIRAALERVRQGFSKRLEESHPEEVLPLIREVNALLDSQESAIEFARARAADLAHGLKTPLSALEGISNDLRRAGLEDKAAALDRISTEIGGRIDHQLRLAQLRARPRGHRMQASVFDAVLRTLNVLQHTEKGEGLIWDVDVPENVSVDMDEQDLAELLGVVLENAVKWARSMASVTAEVVGNAVLITIADDGPGLPEGSVRVEQRGVRLDQSRGGHGMGLAIADEILTINGGSQDLRQSVHGGLEITLMLKQA